MMPEQQFAAIAQKLADLTDLPETGFALRAYLKAAADRDIVDVMNEIEVLARMVAEHAPEKREL
ncbi:hypothetical protein [uncultured Roseobacter sp.]|uniref:hypothetical protein n=1 Tax=uncultured Roseobacter sp. TaxID=114847 RepID=UPI0026219F40|nr:hypothetical protein [uncultured Roseobacter sp.]